MNNEEYRIFPLRVAITCKEDVDLKAIAEYIARTVYDAEEGIGRVSVFDILQTELASKGVENYEYRLCV
jgi:hypothetical protein